MAWPGSQGAPRGAEGDPAGRWISFLTKGQGEEGPAGRQGVS